MALIKTVRGFVPQIGERCYLAENATIVGDVVMGNDCSIWFNAVLRGDVNAIRIGDRVNVQDGSVLHTLYEKSTVHIGNDVSIGHNATIHGADIGDKALIGMGATVLDHAVIGEFSGKDSSRRKQYEYCFEGQPVYLLGYFPDSYQWHGQNYRFQTGEG